ncbi:N-acetyltransferase [Nocardia sp. BMG111209]|uniref:GNAT family N-acetyltransferase n=1 Tax=Nocardia sp. BMG111209 TaxID=1160137 RepID=UPI0003621743|nr:GNAT family N-acetyltransferase [Nocardia sp. BMG111209]
MADDRVVGRGEATQRPDGRIFLSIDAWHEPVFDELAAAMLPNLPAPLYTVVDEVDTALRIAWERAGFAIGRREWEYFLSTGGLDKAPIPEEVTILPLGAARAEPLRLADDTIRAEIEAGAGGFVPVEIVACPDGRVPVDPARYAVAVGSGGYVGLLRIGMRRRHARIEFVGVRVDHRRRGIARALLTEVLGALHRSGIATVSAYVNAADTATLGLFDGIGGGRAGSNLELVLR